MKRKLVLENGSEYIGNSFGSEKEVVGTMSYNTSMAGYQELVSDPVNYGKMICMTYPLIGNYGVTDDDYESRIISPKALIVKEYNDKPSNFRFTQTLREVLEDNDVVGLTHIDTRKLTRELSRKRMVGIITDLDTSKEEALEKIGAYVEENPIPKISAKKRWYSRCSNPKFSVVIVDLGVKFSIINKLKEMGINVTVVPYNFKLEDIERLLPDGIIFSPGPGNPKDQKGVIELAKSLKGKYPILGIGLGHEILALANGMKVEKRNEIRSGSNYPVRNMASGKLELVALNQEYQVVDKDNKEFEISHRDLKEGGIQGIGYGDRCFSVQFNPESSSNPKDGDYVFEKFVEYMREEKGEKNA